MSDEEKGVVFGSISGAQYKEGSKSAFKLRTSEGYKTVAEIEAEGSSGAASGTSIFDPVLCELAYRWWCPAGGVVLDPFSGGSVRGIVAAKLGLRYVGVDLSANQIEANKIQGAEIVPENMPTWINGNSLDIESLTENIPADFIFSCPPYADLEVYSDDPRDLSAMDYNDFRKTYTDIIAACVRQLKPNRFACFVVGDARGRDGFYYGFPWHTIDAFEKAGARLYNEAVLVTAVGSLSVRITRQFDGGGKLGKTHQNVLVFCKGDWKKAAQASLEGRADARLC